MQIQIGEARDFDLGVSLLDGPKLVIPVQENYVEHVSDDMATDTLLGLYVHRCPNSVRRNMSRVLKVSFQRKWPIAMKPMVKAFLQWLGAVRAPSIKKFREKARLLPLCETLSLR